MCVQAREQWCDVLWTDPGTASGTTLNFRCDDFECFDLVEIHLGTEPGVVVVYGIDEKIRERPGEADVQEHAPRTHRVAAGGVRGAGGSVNRRAARGAVML